MRQSGKTLMAEKYEWLRRIWVEEGANPEYHREQQKRLQKEWPTLYNFMVQEFGEPKK